MPSKDFTDTNRFKSTYSENYITAAQYLAEIMCVRIAEKEGVKLPYRFWQTDKWKKVFQLQILKANEWLKIYNIQIILKALKNPRASKIYSLGYKSALEPILQQTQKTFSQVVNNWTKPAEVNEESINSPPKPLPTRKNLIGDLDG